jgi:hypothetical protein
LMACSLITHLETMLGTHTSLNKPVNMKINIAQLLVRYVMHERCMKYVQTNYS